MNDGPIQVTRVPIRIEPDPSRVIPRFFAPGDDAKTRRTIQRVLSLTGEDVSTILDTLRASFRGQHADIEDIWSDHFDRVAHNAPAAPALNANQKLLIGAYFTMEYAVESAALFNPSIIPAFDQSGLPRGSTRFLMSLRATGEGHVSSIVFRRGVIDQNNHIVLESDNPLSRPLEIIEDKEYDAAVFKQTLEDIGALNSFTSGVLSRLGERFTLDDLNIELERAGRDYEFPSVVEECTENMLSLARSNHALEIPEGIYPSEIVIFPSSENESRGIEDVRLVHFTEDEGSSRLYGTYTAYNGFVTFPTLLEASEDFRKLEIHTMYGRYAKNKGMAIFPRRIRGNYVMSARLDGENLYVLESDNIRYWERGRIAQSPKYWWEMTIIGNCGSPIETSDGWLLLTHGVGPMRQYCIGAALLDLDDPSRLIGRTREPLIVPTGHERVGYVPNVAYTCGAMAHNDVVVIPYAMSDMVTTFATVPLSPLVDLLKKG